MNDLSKDHLMREDRDSLEALLKRIETLIPMAEAHGQCGVVRYLVMAKAEIGRLIAVGGGVKPH